MEAIRKIVSVDMLSPIVNLPWKKDMQVEVIIIPVEEEIPRQKNFLENFKEYSPALNVTKLSDKFRGVFSKEAGKSFMEHTKNMREEWDSI
jgi:hypothetical protein